MVPDNPITLRQWPNAILHMDGDAFFASCEQSVHPELKGKPVMTGQERSIVASMSYEAKACGIQRGMTVREARKVCPGLTVLPSDYETYSLISKKMFSIMRRFTPHVEESSIDEGYLELNGLRRLYRTGYPEIAKQIKETIEKELGISISSGLSLTKTLAKLASKYKKPRGFTAVKGTQIHLFLRQIPVEKVCGIGPNTTAFLHKKGVRTTLDYIQKSEPWAKFALGKIGTELWHELRGEMAYPLNTALKTTYASISKSKTFRPPSSDYAYVRAQLYRNIESAFIKLRRYRLNAQNITVYLRKQDFKNYGLECHLNRPTTSALEAFPFIEKMLQTIFQPDTLYRSTGVVLNHLHEDTAMQFELFEDPVRMIRMHRLAESIDQINHHYGKHTVFSATGLYLKRSQGKDGAPPGARNVLPQRKRDLLPGETFRRRLGIPVVGIKI